MVFIWEKDPFPYGDARLPHHTYPPKMLTPDELFKRTGVHVWKVDITDALAVTKRVTTLKLERKFNHEDIFIIDIKTALNFFEKLDDLYEPRSNSDEEAKLILAGEVYYDIEHGEKWIRVLCEPGDLILVPENCWHRVTTTPKNFLKMKRFFKSHD